MSDARRHFLPREHGAWVQLLVPLVCALAMGTPGLAAAGLAVAAVAVFVSHEPVLVVLGHRGARQRARDAARARHHLLVGALVAGVAGVLGLAHAPEAAWIGLAAAVVPAIALVPYLRARRERTTIGESLSALGMVGASLPVALASGVTTETALAVWGVWCAAFVLLTLSVRGVLAASRKARRSTRLLWLAAAAASVVQAGLVGAALAALAPAGLAWAFAPVTLFTVGLAVRPVGPKRLRAVGLSLLGASLVSAGVLIATLG